MPDNIRLQFIQTWEEYEQGRTKEAILVKALDKTETIIQHNQGKNPDNFNYEFNLIYGKEWFKYNEFLLKLRDILDDETSQKL